MSSDPFGAAVTDRPSLHLIFSVLDTKTGSIISSIPKAHECVSYGSLELLTRMLTEFVPAHSGAASLARLSAQRTDQSDLVPVTPVSGDGRR